MCKTIIYILQVFKEILSKIKDHCEWEQYQIYIIHLFANKDYCMRIVVCSDIYEKIHIAKRQKY